MSTEPSREMLQLAGLVGGGSVWVWIRVQVAGKGMGMGMGMDLGSKSSTGSVSSGCEQCVDAIL